MQKNHLGLTLLLEKLESQQNPQSACYLLSFGIQTLLGESVVFNPKSSQAPFMEPRREKERWWPAKSKVKTRTVLL